MRVIALYAFSLGLAAPLAAADLTKPSAALMEGLERIAKNPKPAAVLSLPPELGLQKMARALREFHLGKPDEYRLAVLASVLGRVKRIQGAPLESIAPVETREAVLAKALAQHATALNLKVERMVSNIRKAKEIEAGWVLNAAEQAEAIWAHSQPFLTPRHAAAVKALNHSLGSHANSLREHGETGSERADLIAASLQESLRSLQMDQPHPGPRPATGLVLRAPAPGHGLRVPTLGDIERATQGQARRLHAFHQVAEGPAMIPAQDPKRWMTPDDRSDNAIFKKSSPSELRFLRARFLLDQAFRKSAASQFFRLTQSAGATDDFKKAADWLTRQIAGGPLGRETARYALSLVRSHLETLITTINVAQAQQSSLSSQDEEVRARAKEALNALQGLAS